MKRSSPRRPAVSADGEGVVSHAGSLLPHELADRSGLTGMLSRGLADVFSQQRRHEPGAVIRDLAVSLVDGGDCLSDLAVLREQPDLFGTVASDPTAYRMIERLGRTGLEPLRQARAAARAWAWGSGAAPSRIVLDLDATLLIAHSEKEGAAATYKRGFGFHPLLCSLDGSNEVLAGMLRPGNAGANNTADHVTVFDQGMAQLPPTAARSVLVRADSAGATHKFLDHVVTQGHVFSVGFDLTEPVREAVLAVPERAWVPALTQDGEERDGAAIAELTGLDLSRWPVGSRAICRREEPHPGAQLTFTDHNGYRFQVLLTNQADADIAYLEALHRGHARVEDRIRIAKQMGLENLPFREWGANTVWLELVLMATDLMVWMQRVTLQGEAQGWEPKRLRHRLLHVAGRLSRSGRRLRLRLTRTWAWARDLVAAFDKLRALPAA